MVAEAANTVCKRTTITNWYGESKRMIEIASQTAVWYSTGLFAVPIRWVLVRDPKGEFKTHPTASLSTALLSGLDFGCLSPHFEHLLEPFPPQCTRGKHRLAGRSA